MPCRCAAAIQTEPAGKRNPTDLQVRIGIHFGDVIVDGDDIYGDGVNIASRLEGIAEPGGICVSERVYEEVRNKLDIGFVPLGDRQLKNMATPVTVFGLVINEPERVAAASEPLRLSEAVPPRSKSPLGAYMRAMRRYFEAKGRSDRFEFWSFVLVAVILTMIAGTLDALFFRRRRGVGRRRALRRDRHARPPDSRRHRRHSPHARPRPDGPLGPPRARSGLRLALAGDPLRKARHARPEPLRPARAGLGLTADRYRLAALPRLRRRVGEPLRHQPVAAARARLLAVGDRVDECVELAPIGVGVALQEEVAAPGRSAKPCLGRRSRPWSRGCCRRAACPPSRGPRCAGRSHRRRAASWRSAQSLPDAVFIMTIAVSTSPALPIAWIDQRPTRGEDHHRLLAEEEARHVEIVDHHVAIEPARALDIGDRRRTRVARDHRDDLDLADGALVDAAS